MDFLIDDFLDQLTAEIEDNGNVLIEAASFSPQQIIQELDKSAFEYSFSEWCENRKIELFCKADEILDLYDNRKRFEALKKIYDKGSVTPFIGAGMSIPSDYPGWTEFLRNLIAESRVDSNIVEELLGSSGYEEAAQLINDGMGANEFNEALDNAFLGGKKIQGPIRFLPTLFPNSVITTNFDDILKRLYDDAANSFSDILYGADAVDLPRLLGRDDKILVKLHGKATSIRNRVLTLDEYNAHYSDNSILNTCINAISNTTLLFLGCSLGTDRTLQCLKEKLKRDGIESTSRHYAFVLDSNSLNRLTRKRELSEANIFPIWYQDEHDESIEALFLKLMESD